MAKPGHARNFADFPSKRAARQANLAKRSLIRIAFLYHAHDPAAIERGFLIFNNNFVYPVSMHSHHFILDSL